MILTYDHPRWLEFARSVETRSTECDHAHPRTRAALRAIAVDEDASIAWLENEGGYCDCEVVFNVLVAATTKEDT
jgi:hypothetical protein